MTDTVNVLSRGKEGVDTKELRQLTRDFMDWKPDKALKKMLRGAGDLIAADAKANIAPYSKSIPPTVKVRIAKTRVSVVAGGAGVPIGGLFELGNKGHGKSQAAARSGTFRHPVFGDRTVWVNQKMHPYLLRAAESNKSRLEHLEGQMVKEAFNEYRFPMSSI